MNRDEKVYLKLWAPWLFLMGIVWLTALLNPQPGSLLNPTPSPTQIAYILQPTDIAVVPSIAPVRPALTASPKPSGGTVKPAASPHGSSTLWGEASWYASNCNCTAMRIWRGRAVWVRGPVGEVRVRINDYGPAKWTGRIIDLNPNSFQAVCGRLSKGVCDVRVTLLD